VASDFSALGAFLFGFFKEQFGQTGSEKLVPHRGASDFLLTAQIRWGNLPGLSLANLTRCARPKTTDSYAVTSAKRMVVSKLLPQPSHRQRYRTRCSSTYSDHSGRNRRSPHCVHSVTTDFLASLIKGHIERSSPPFFANSFPTMASVVRQ